LRTAALWAREKSEPHSDQAIPAAPLIDVTDKMTVLYAGEQRLDHETKSVTLCISLRSNSLTTISGPLYLHVDTTSSDFGAIELVNPTPEASLGVAYVNVSSSLHGGSLSPGDTTAPYPLTFRFSEDLAPGPNRFFLLKMKLRVFSRQQR